jgi:metal-responsive CopG/Arc/MetJ family transcriptional regulator
MLKSKHRHDLLNCYFSHLEYIQDKKLNTLDPVKKTILDLVFLNTKNGIFCTITQYINNRNVGSLATMHKHIHELITANYLKIVFLSGKRKKTVLLSDKGITFITDLGRAIEASTYA